MPVDYHAWTHRPKALGGTDPIPGAGLIPWVRRTKGYNSGLIVPGVFLDDEVTLGLGVGNEPDITEGSSDYLDYFSFPQSYQITPEIHGIYEVLVVVLWDVNFDGPSWFYLHDGVGFPEALPGHDRPSNYGQLGSSTNGYWSGRYDSGRAMQIDVAQLSGSNKEVDAWYIEMRYRGDYDGPERNDSLFFDH